MDSHIKLIRRQQRGFTLIELLIVIAIIAILAALATLNIAEYRAKAIESGMVSDIKNFGTAMYAINYDCRDYTSALANPAGPVAIVTGNQGSCILNNATQSIKVTTGNLLSFNGVPTATTYKLCVTNPGATRPNRQFVAANESGNMGWAANCPAAVLAIP